MQVVDKTVEGPQVHLTGVMKLDDPDAKIKFLAEEALHGVGGFVFDANGNRAAYVLPLQNCVTGEMWKNKPPFSPSLNNAISDDIAWQRKHYTGRGVRKLHESGTTLAEGMEAPVLKMPDSIEAHCQASLKSAKDPDGGPYPAFASDKSWSEASGKTGSEKKFYHNVSSGADFTAPILENSPAEYMKPALTVTCAHATPVVENATVQRPQEIVYEHPAPLTGAAPGVTNRQVGEKLADDVVSEIKDLKSDLVHIRELLGVLVRKEKCAETKAEIAARRLDRMEREQHEADDAEHEANFQEALQNQSKAVKVLVDKWFVDKGFGFG